MSNTRLQICSSLSNLRNFAGISPRKTVSFPFVSNQFKNSNAAVAEATENDRSPPLNEVQPTIVIEGSSKSPEKNTTVRAVSAMVAEERLEGRTSSSMCC